jgi:hypothetical protein
MLNDIYAKNIYVRTCLKMQIYFFKRIEMIFNFIIFTKHCDSMWLE